ncbi:MAG: dihydrodipicolinate synthase family protein [Planctomycetota bacterium]
MPSHIDPNSLLTPGRKIEGISAILLPFAKTDDVDWTAFDAHVVRTLDAGLAPAVNMDTGYGHLIDESTRIEVLKRTENLAAGRKFVAGAFVKDDPGSRFDADAYQNQMDQIQSFGGIPVVVQSFGLNAGSDDEILSAFEMLGSNCDAFYAFELGEMFAPFGKIYSIEVYSELMKIKSCIGAKHSSLSRILEWQRLAIRNEQRPDFQVCTGNDLAIDMVMYGSDYLLGLSIFAPEAFAKRDAMWQAGDPGFYELNDVLQYLGMFAFRSPVPAYKHSAAQFLHLRGLIETSRTHPNSMPRPKSDLLVLQGISDQLDQQLRRADHS